MNNIDPKPTTKISSKLFSLLKIILIIGILGLFYIKFYENWTEVITYDWTIDVPLFLLSLLFHLLTFIVFSKIWCILISAFGFRIKLRHAFKIGYITNLGRYIPGKVWPVLGMAYLAKKFDIPEETSVTSWIVALIFTLPSAFLVVIISFFLSPKVYFESLGSIIDISMIIIALLITSVSFLLLFIPNKLFFIFNYFLKMMKRPLIKFHIDVKTAFLVYFGYFFCWVCYGFAFWLLLTSLVPDKSIPIIPTIGTYVLAYQIGYLAFFAPGGIGVREFILSTILLPVIGPVAAGISVVARVWNMIIELIAAIIAWLIKLPNGKRL